MTDQPTDASRLFVAIELSEPWRAHLAALTSLAGRGNPHRYRWVSPELLHLTLLFLDRQPTSLLPAIRANVEAAASVSASFALRLGRLGDFGGRRSRILWAAVEGGLGLSSLRGRLEEHLDRQGIAYDRKAFRPHITLARARASASLGPSQIDWPEPGLSLPEPQLVEQIALVQSDLGHGGPRYTALARVPLTGCDRRQIRAEF